MGVLGLILARGGSKRVPKKNVRILGGRPLVDWTLGAARASGAFDEIVLSSDNPEILTRAYDFGAIRLKRPMEMATDEASPYPAILHALDNYPAQHVCLLQPTSPFRTAFDINYALAMYFAHGGVPIASAEYGKRVPNGAIYIGSADWLKDGQSWDQKEPFGPGLCFMPPARSLDIDTEEDWIRAEAMLSIAV